MTQTQTIEQEKKRRSKPKTKRKLKADPVSNVINLRADAATRTLIDRAAAVSGQNRTEFMLRSARMQAEHVLLNQVYFQLNEADWDALNSTLSDPPPANAALKKLTKRKPAWDA